MFTNVLRFAATLLDHTAFVWRNIELRKAISRSYLVTWLTYSIPCGFGYNSARCLARLQGYPKSLILSARLQPSTQTYSIIILQERKMHSKLKWPINVYTQKEVHKHSRTLTPNTYMTTHMNTHTWTHTHMNTHTLTHTHMNTHFQPVFVLAVAKLYAVKESFWKICGTDKVIIHCIVRVKSLLEVCKHNDCCTLTSINAYI